MKKILPVFIVLAFLLGLFSGFLGGRFLPADTETSIIVGSRPAPEEIDGSRVNTSAGLVSPVPAEGRKHDDSGASALPAGFAVLEGTAVAELPEEVPLKGMVVTLDLGGRILAQMFTDESGRFSFAIRESGEAVIRLFLNGSGKPAAVEKVRLTRGETAKLRLALKPVVETKITGRVLTTEGEPVCGAEIFLDKAREPTVHSGISDSAGCFEITGVRPFGRLFSRHEIVYFSGGEKPEEPARFTLRVVHPDFAEGREGLVFTHPLDVPEETRREIMLRTIGIVSGFVRTQDGMLLDDRLTEQSWLTWTLHFERGSYGANAPISRGTFRLEIEQKGALTIGGKVGRVRYRHKNVGEVSTATRLSGVEIIADVLPEKRILLFDESGQSIGDCPERFEISIRARETGDDHSDSENIARVVDGSVVIVVDFEAPVFMNLQADGFEPALMRLDPQNIPERLTLKKVPPLVRGVLRLPDGKTLDDLDSHLIFSDPSGAGGRNIYFDQFDSASGRFAIARPVERHPDVIYSIRFMINGYKTWSLDQFKVRWGETMEDVNVEFRKED